MTASCCSQESDSEDEKEKKSEKAGVLRQKAVAMAGERRAKEGEQSQTQSGLHKASRP